MRDKPIGGGGGSKREAALLVVATPIGNLEDVTARALRALREADLIACEDTRTTAKLLAAHGIGTATTPYHDHNAERARPKLLKALQRMHPAAGHARAAREGGLDLVEPVEPRDFFDQVGFKRHVAPKCRYLDAQ